MFCGCVVNASLFGAAGLITTPIRVPVVELESVPIIFTVSATMSLVLMVKAPFDKVFVLSPNVLSPLLSNCAFPVLLFSVTIVVLSGTV